MPMWIHALPLRTTGCPAEHKGVLRAIRQLPGDPADLWLAGNYDNVYSPLAPAVLRYVAGTGWTVWHLPYPDPTGAAALRGIAPWAADAVWAAGIAQTAVVYAWDGSGWSVVDSQANFGLGGIAAFAADDVWAVGDIQPGDGARARVWDGAGWATVAPSHSDLALSSVEAGDGSDATNVWYAGQVGGDQWADQFAGTASGSEWAGVTSGRLLGLWVVAADSVWAAGVDSTGAERADLVYYDGTGWTALSAPPAVTGQHASRFNAVHGTAAGDDVWAVGRADVGSSPYVPHPYVCHWDGSAWTYYPGPASVVGELWGVVARATDDVWACGTYTPPGCPATMLLYHWDGATWTRTPVPPGAHALAEDVTSLLTADCTESGGDNTYTYTLTWTNTGATTYSVDYTLDLLYFDAFGDPSAVPWSAGAVTQSIPPGVTVVTGSTAAIPWDSVSYSWQLLAGETWATGEGRGILTDPAPICGL